MTDKTSLKVAKRLKDMGWHGTLGCPTIGELQAAVTDEDICDWYESKNMNGLISDVLRSADLLADVWMWKKGKGKR